MGQPFWCIVTQFFTNSSNSSMLHNSIVLHKYQQYLKIVELMALAGFRQSTPYEAIVHHMTLHSAIVYHPGA